MSQNAIGMIETKGLIAAIEAADVMLKSANVEIVGSKYHKVRSGIIAVVVTGDVGAVKSAVEAGSDAAKKIGKVLAVDVIARTDNSVLNMLMPHKDKKGKETKLEEMQEKINKKEIKKEKYVQKLNEKEEKQEEIKIENVTKVIKIEESQTEIKKEDNKKLKDTSKNKDKLENDDKLSKSKKSKK
ncbi:BMC domain-containing protein [Clostridium sp. CCUG 7971]|uniref:BMC domain-containing protein n=1 Tax=Clostridium sp. CCUG 7971 TaxID=2811414 RepID=UPI001ABB0A0F|nr:BMC domain-containing protein [Clostridium sp. CCUG 7971]MBO3443807.1 BMC domain-containing protein [Clostridium sp. CCUG 7971]